MVPFSNTEFTTNDVIDIESLSYPAALVTIIVQFEYVPSLKLFRVIVLFPEIAVVVLEEHEPP